MMAGGHRLVLATVPCAELARTAAMTLVRLHGK